MTKKMKLTTLLCSIAAVCLSGGVLMEMQDIDAKATTMENIKFSMQKGASIRLRAESNGMRFSASIDQKSYEAIENDEVSYGMLIMPEDYVSLHGDLTVENVFGEAAKYDWKKENEEYTGTKTRIINITYDELGKPENGEYIIRGSITNVKETNLGRDFVARAYINNNGTYYMAEYAENHIIHNTRSMLDVAESALSDTSDEAITAGQKDSVRAEYLEGYTAVSTYEEFCAMASDGRYYLANDIDFAGQVNNGNGATGAFLTAQAFSGKFYGNGYALKNVTIGAAEASFGSYRSLFGELSGTVRDVKITATVNTTNEEGLYGDAVIANKMTDGVIDDVDLNVKYEKTNHVGYTEGESWTANTSISAGMVQNFLKGVIKNSTVTIETPTNVSTTDGIVAVSNVNWTQGFDYAPRLIDNVQVYAKSADMKVFVNQLYANPIVTNSAVHVSLADSILTKDGEAVEDDLATGYSKTTKYTSGDYETGLPVIGNIELAKYSQIDFAHKQTSTKRYFILYSVYDDRIYRSQETEWTNISLRKQADGLWSLYANGELHYEEGKPMIDLYGVYLSDILGVEFGGEGEASDYYLSNVTAVKDDSYTAPAYKLLSENLFAVGATECEEAAPEGFEKVVSHATSWNKYNFNDFDLSNFTYVRFAVKSEGNYGVIFGTTTNEKGEIVDNVINETTNGGNWLIISLTKHGDAWDLRYGDKIEQSLILANENLTDLNFRFGDNTYYVTELQGLYSPDYVRPVLPNVLENPIAKAATSTSTDESDLAEGASITNVINCGWTATTFASDIVLAQYTQLSFFYKVDNVDKYFEMYGVDNTQYCGGNSFEWTEIKFLRENGTWMIYVGGECKAVGLTGKTLSDIVPKIQLGGNATANVYLSNLMGIVDPDYVPPTPPVYEVVTENVFNVAATESTEVAPEGFEKVVSHTTGYGTYSFNPCDLTPYTEVKFAVKSSGWYGVMSDAFTVINETTNGGNWLIISLVKNGGNWDLYYGDTNQKTLTLANNNLTDLNFRFGANTYYVTELRGIADPNYVPPIEPVWEGVSENNVFTAAATESTEVAPEGFEKVVSHATTWSKYSFNDFDLSNFTHVRFAVKSSGWYGVMNGDTVINETDGGGDWLIISLVKNGGNWDLYYGGVFKQTLTLANNNLTDLNFRFGSNTYHVTELQGSYSPDYVRPVAWTNGEHPFDLTGTLVTDDIAEGFTTTTKLTTSWNKYNFKSFDLTPFTEVKFAVKSTGYYGVMSDAFTVINETTNGGNWLIISLVKNGGNWDLYYGDTNQKTLTLANNNLTDLNFRFGANTYYVSEIIGIKDPEWSNTIDYTVYEKNPVKMQANATTTYFAFPDSVGTTVINCGYTSTSFIDGVKLNNFSEIKFYYKVDNADKYLEFYDEGGNQLFAGNSFNWTEIKFLPAENGTWTLYVNGKSTKTGLTGATLSELFPVVRLGGNATANVYLSELLVKESETLNIVVNNNSDYIIVYDGNETQSQTAATELQTYFNQATGATLNVEAYSEQAFTGNYIFVGGGIAKSAGMPFDDLTSPSHYNLESKGRAIYVYGNHYYGTNNGIYALLAEWFGYQAYAEDVYDIDSVSTLTVKPFAITKGLAFDYQLAGYGMINDLQSPNAKADEQLGFITDYMVSGGGAHNALTLISMEDYGSAHPEWFYTGTTADGCNTGDQLYLAAEDFATGEGTLVTTVAEKFVDIVKDNPNLNIFSFSAMDIDIWPNGEGYENSDSLYNTYKTYAAEMIIFMNAVAKELEGMIDKEITLQMLAYNKTLCAPKLDGLTQEQKDRIMLYQGAKVKVAPYIAPVEANYTMKFDDVNNTVKNPLTGERDDGSPTVGEVIQNWKAISGGGDMFLWWYGLDCDSYFMVMDTITNMQAQYQFAKDNGITTMYVQAHYDTPVSSDWAALKIYLQSVLAKDVNADVDAAIDKFMGAYFGPAKDSMKSLLQKEQVWYKKLRGDSKQDNGYNLGRLRGSTFFTAGTGNQVQWTYNLSTSLFYGGANKMINEWRGFINSAKAAINDDSSLTDAEKTKYLKRIEIEALTVRWVGAKVFELETVDEVYAAAQALGITHSAEGTPIA